MPLKKHCDLVYSRAYLFEDGVRRERLRKPYYQTDDKGAVQYRVVCDVHLRSRTVVFVQWAVLGS